MPLDAPERDCPITGPSGEPHVYCRLTDNWVQLALRFVANICGTRELKDRMSRDILSELKPAKIGVASTTVAVVRNAEALCGTRRES